MKAYRIIAVVILSAVVLSDAYGQDFRRAYEDFSKSAMEAHRNFCDSLNTEFARTISFNWEQFQMSEPDSNVGVPQPDSPTVAVDSDKSSRGVLKTSEIIDTQLFLPEILVPHSNSAEVQNRLVRFRFYDTIQEAIVPAVYGSFHPSGISESDVGEFWRRLGREDFSEILFKCIDIRDNCGFNDWAVVEWIQTLSCAIFPKNINSERKIFEVFLLNQIGLMAKLARVNESLEFLFASLQPVYARKYAIIDTYQYYLADGEAPSSSIIYTYRSNFSGKLRPLDLRIKNPLVLGNDYSYELKNFKSQVFGCEMIIPVNNALMSFYKRYPQTTVSVYAQSAPDNKFSNALLGQLKEKMIGLGVPIMINELLRFMHYDFSYKVDTEQFGYEKQFFCEENFIYEANDCEDRAILFSFLVRGLTGRKVVLLEYDDHIATAVNFDEDCDGHYVNLADGRYYICDPTFIGATAGMCMPEYIAKKARIYVL